MFVERRGGGTPPVQPPWTAAFLVVVLACRPAVSEVECFASAVPRVRATEVTVGPSSICVPEGVLLLIRSEDGVTALRFHDVRDIDASVSTGCARYELHTQSNGAWRTTAGTVSVLGWFGVHPLVGEHGRTTIGKLQYNHPACVRLQPGYEYAPTGWTELRNVNERAARLQWFRIDGTQSRSLTIPLQQLPL